MKTLAFFARKEGRAKGGDRDTIRCDGWMDGRWDALERRMEGRKEGRND